MTNRSEPSRARALAAAILLVAGGAFAVLSPGGLAQDQKPAPRAPAAEGAAIWVTEIDRDGDSGELHVLLNAGRDAGLERGDVLDVERDGKTIGTASVYTVWSDAAVATVEKGSGPVARGDWVRPRAKKNPRPAPAPEAPIKVTSVTNAVAAIDAGSERGLREGQEGTILRAGRPVGRARVRSLAPRTASLEVVEGEVLVGDVIDLAPDAHGHGKRDPLEPDLTREELRRIEREAGEVPKGLDFAAASFLGVVAELEHPVPVAASCHVGVLVRRVVAGSPAEKATIRPGDRVIAVDDRIVRTPVEIHRAVKRRTGDFVRVTLARDDVLQTVSADFRKRP